MSAVLDKLAAQDAAEVQAVSADYASALAAIVLRQAVGLPLPVDAANTTARVQEEPEEGGGAK